MSTTKPKYLSVLIVTAVCAFVAGFSANVVAQRSQPIVKSSAAAVQHPLFSEYRGVRLGMTATEVVAKLGEPTMNADDQQFFVLSEKETAQIAYDTNGKAKTISVDFIGGVNAPDYKTVVGTELDKRPDGSAHKLVWYETDGLWVSYNRSAGPVVIVTVTIQKI